MRTELLGQEKNIVRVKVEFEAAEFMADLNKVIRDITQKANIPGFQYVAEKAAVSATAAFPFASSLEVAPIRSAKASIFSNEACFSAKTKTQSSIIRRSMLVR